MILFHRDQEPQERNPSEILFAQDVVRGEMCAFVPGYFMFIAETKVTVQSVLHFMPGMRVVVAVHPSDAHVYGRYARCVPRSFTTWVLGG